MSSTTHSTPRLAKSRQARSPRLGATVQSDNLRRPGASAERALQSTRNVLTKAEIEALLRPDLTDLPAPPKRVEEKTVPTFDAPAAKERQAIEADVARYNGALQRQAGLKVALRLKSVAGCDLRESTTRLPRGSVLTTFLDAEGTVQGFLGMDQSCAAALVEAASGASPTFVASAPPRNPTQLDRVILAEAFSPVAAVVAPSLAVSVHDDAALASATVPPGEARELELEISLAGRVWPASLVLLKRIAQPSETLDGPRPERAAMKADGLTAILTARIASLSVPVSRIASLKPGETLLLGLPPDEPVQLLSGGRDGTLAAEGEVGRKGSHMAVRIRRTAGLIG